MSRIGSVDVIKHQSQAQAPRLSPGASARAAQQALDRAELARTYGDGEVQRCEQAIAALRAFFRHQPEKVKSDPYLRKVNPESFRLSLRDAPLHVAVADYKKTVVLSGSPVAQRLQQVLSLEPSLAEITVGAPQV